MACAPDRPAAASEHELRFRSLYAKGRALAFPCDAQGRVDLERLSPAARENLRRAQALVGIDFEAPEVVRLTR
ncbi:MAG: hypothetical protein JNJ42_04150 [Burkholderiaceae bacterium]|nr:hypothetical protein [Burkholderiaceae bacterium]